MTSMNQTPKLQKRKNRTTSLSWPSKSKFSGRRCTLLLLPERLSDLHSSSDNMRRLQKNSNQQTRHWKPTILWIPEVKPHPTRITRRNKYQKHSFYSPWYYQVCRILLWLWSKSPRKPIKETISYVRSKQSKHLLQTKTSKPSPCQITAIIWMS